MTIKHSLTPRYWMSKVTACDICNNPIDGAFTDGKTHSGPWAIMCDHCLPMHSIGRTTHHGQGLSQYYERQADGRYMKTRG